MDLIIHEWGTLSPTLQPINRDQLWDWHIKVYAFVDIGTSHVLYKFRYF